MNSPFLPLGPSVSTPDTKKGRVQMTAETQTSSVPQQRSSPRPEFTDAEAGALEFPDSTERHFNYYKPAKRKQSHYEDVTV